ncbi:TraX family protein [Lacrimispora sphenoides]
MSSTSLKILAAILMLIDHIGEFIPGMPIYLRWFGRISAPIFFIVVH